MGSPSSGPRVGEAALGPGGKAWPSRFRMVFRGEVPHVRSGGWSDVVAVEGGSAPVPRTVRHVGGGAGPSGRGQRADGAFVGGSACVGAGQDRMDGGGVVVARRGPHGVRPRGGRGGRSGDAAVRDGRVDVGVHRVEDRGGAPVGRGRGVGRVVPPCARSGRRQGAVPSDDGHAACRR